MANLSGNLRGKKGRSGRKGYGIDKKVATLKGILIDAVLEDCEKNPPRKLFWAEKFVTRLMPQEITGGGGEPFGIILYPQKDEVKEVKTENTLATPA